MFQLDYDMNDQYRKLLDLNTAVLVIRLLLTPIFICLIYAYNKTLKITTNFLKM